jgi:peptide deformylase
MWRFSMVVAAWLACAAVARAAPISFVEDDYPRALAAARHRNVPLFVDAWAPWCHTCVFMREHVLSRPELGIHGASFVFLSIDTEQERNAAFVRKFPLEAWPTLFVVDPRDESVLVKWVGSASVSELGKLLADGRMAASRVLAQSHRDLAEADRLFGRGKAVEAARAYRELLSAAEPEDERRGRILLSLLAAQHAAGDKRACAEVALAEASKLPPGGVRANAVGWGLSCAAAGAGEAEAALRKLAEEAVNDPGVLADDRSSLYEALVDACTRAGDAERARPWAEKWWAFLEDEARRAKSAAARAVYDAHRVGAAIASGKPERVLPVLEQSARELPRDYNPPARMALVLRDLGRLDDALAAIDRALGLAYGPRKLRLFDTKAAILEKKGDGPARAATLKAALDHAKGLPPSPRRDEAIQKLSQAVEAVGPATAASTAIVQAGHPALRKRAVEVSAERVRSEEFQALVRSMVDAMRKAPGVGLAAPQLGVSERVIVLEDTEERMSKLTPEERAERGRAPFPLTVLVNPVLAKLGDEKAIYFEGCLSVAGFSALVERHAEVEVSGLDEKGEPKKWRVKGWPARILQHELDHLDGTLYVDRMHSRSFMTTEQARALYGGKPGEEIRRLLVP